MGRENNNIGKKRRKSGQGRSFTFYKYSFQRECVFN